MVFRVTVEGLESLAEFTGLDKKVAPAAARAINKVARDQRSKAERLISEQVNFPSGYLSQAQGRLAVTNFAKPSQLAAVITARGRPTSLARFAKRQTSRTGVTVEVKPGKAIHLKNSFLLKLRAGASQVETKFNMGLAVRLAPGERIANKVRQIQVSKGLYLLYGPSVQQVFLDNSGNGVASDISNETSRRLEEEFIRQVER